MKMWASKYLIWKAMKIPPFNRDAYLRPRIVLLGCLEPEADWILVKELVHTLPSLEVKMSIKLREEAFSMSKLNTRAFAFLKFC